MFKDKGTVLVLEPDDLLPYYANTPVLDVSTCHFIDDVKREIETACVVLCRSGTTTTLLKSRRWVSDTPALPVSPRSARILATLRQLHKLLH